MKTNNETTLLDPIIKEPPELYCSQLSRLLLGIVATDQLWICALTRQEVKICGLEAHAQLDSGWFKSIVLTRPDNAVMSNIVRETNLIDFLNSHRRLA